MVAKKKEYERKKVVETQENKEPPKPNIVNNIIEEINEAVRKVEGYKGKIMVKKSPIFKQWKGAPLSEITHLSSNEVIAVDPNDKRVKIMLKNGNLQFVSNQIRPSPTGEYPRIVED